MPVTFMLWTDARTALLSGRWLEARAALETLLSRADLSERLAPIASYITASRADLTPSYARLLQDRIDAVNARVQANIEAASR